MNAAQAARYAPVVQAAAQQWGVPVKLANALIEHESRWNPLAVREEPKQDADPKTPGIQPDASRGLTQILYRTAVGQGYTGTPGGLFDAATNVRYGLKYLAAQYRRAGSWPAALSAFNGGYDPKRGMGVRLTRAGRVILARDQETGEPIRWYDAKVGEFGNQPYVNAVLAIAAEYGWHPPSAATPLSALLAPAPKASPGTTPAQQTVGLWVLGSAAAAALLYAVWKLL